MGERDGAWRGRRLALAAAALLTACGDPTPARRAAPGVEAAPAPAAAGARGPSACLHDGRWRPCAIVERLERAGLVIHTDTGQTRVPFLTPVGAHYTASQADLRVFLYDDARLADREALALDRFSAVPRGSTFRWPQPATVIHSGNLVAILLSANARQVERIQLALEAGAPQADGPAEPRELPAAVAH